MPGNDVREVDGFVDAVRPFKVANDSVGWEGVGLSIDNVRKSDYNCRQPDGANDTDDAERPHAGLQRMHDGAVSET